MTRSRRQIRQRRQPIEQVESAKAQISAQIAEAEANGNTDWLLLCRSALAAVSGISVDAGVSEIAPVTVQDVPVKVGSVDTTQIKRC